MKALCFLLLISTQALAVVLPVVIEKKVHEDYVEFVGDRDPLTINQFGGIKARRSTVEIVLLQQAFALGGLPVELQFHIAPGAERMRRMVMLHGYAMAANTVWDSVANDTKDLLWVSAPVIRHGEFEAGLYTVGTRYDLLDEKYRIDIEKLAAVSSSQWVSDWNTLSELPLTNLINVTDWRSMVEMVVHNRVDFLLAPFQGSKDLSFEARGYRFLPIEGVKLGLSGSRHFILSRSFPNSERLAEVLDRGINILRQKGTIVRALQECGFFNAQVTGWRKLN
ncbi:hypothetical protein AB2S62_19145 [Vibrio sp. NTOU-M3]|uniref:hypothetical protein n=1 Tax=Vibrio sp. NTOU-M3 TaxID=3234954 RepID=UPI00349F8CE0